MLLLVLILLLLLIIIPVNLSPVIVGGNPTPYNIYENKKYFKLFETAINLPPQDATIKFKDIPNRFNYIENTGTCRVLRANANGQRKLFLEQVQFLTMVHNKIDILLYTGTSPGSLHGYVHVLFPKIKQILVDPNDHNIFMGDKDDYKTKRYLNELSHTMYTNPDIVYLYDNSMISTKSDNFIANIYDFDKDIVVKLDRKDDKELIKDIMKNNKFTKNKVEQVKNFINNSNYKFYIIQDYFTDGMSEFFKDVLKDTRFAYTSDIRTRDEDIIDYAVLWNLAQQFTWTKILDPLYYKLKFRLPFKGTIDLNKLNKNTIEDLNKYKDRYNIDQISDYKKGIMKYFPGEIYLQAWPPVTSTESRLIGTKEDLKKDLVTYKEEEYTSKYFYYNMIHRQFVRHKNKYFNPDIGICYCADCALECHILDEYKNTIDIDFDVVESIMILRKLTRFQNRTNNPPHGFYKQTTFKEVKQLIKEYKPDCNI